MSTFFEQVGEKILPIAAKYDVDNLPPTYRDFLNSPQVQQSQMLSSFQLLQQMAQTEQADQEYQDRMRRALRRMKRQRRR